MPEYVRVVVGAVIIVVAAGLGIAFLDSVASMNVSQDPDSSTAAITAQNETVLLDGAGNWTTIDSGTGTNETVFDSRGHAINLTGADDSYVESESQFEIAADKTWTIHVGARVDSAAQNDTMTAISANGRVVVTYNGSVDEWQAWYYEEDDRDSYQVNVSATNQPQNYTHVFVQSNGTHISIYRNTTQGSVANISQNDTVAAPINNSNWNGRLDELRTFDDPLTSTERSNLVADPVAPRVGTNRTSRIMFDEPARATQRIFFTDTDLQTSNATYSDGFAGSTMVNGTDYEWDTDGPRIKPLAGGDLDGAPVAYVDYDLEGGSATLLTPTLNSWADFVQVAILVPLILVAVLILRLLRGA